MSVKKTQQDAAAYAVETAVVAVPLPIAGGSYQLINGQLVKDSDEPAGDSVVKEN